MSEKNIENFVIHGALVDRAIAEGLEDIRQGRLHGPFETYREMIEFLHGEVKKAKARRRKKR